MEYKFQHCYCAELDDSAKFSLTPYTFPDSSFCLETFPHISITRMQSICRELSTLTDNEVHKTKGTEKRQDVPYVPYSFSFIPVFFC